MRLQQGVIGQQANINLMNWGEQVLLPCCKPGRGDLHLADGPDAVLRVV